jgi:hypothetical protein
MLHYATLCYTMLHYASLCYTMLHCAKLCYTALNCTTLHYTVLHCTALYCITLHYTHYTTLHNATLRCSVLHCTTLCCTTLLYTSFRSTSLHFPTIFSVQVKSNTVQGNRHHSREHVIANIVKANIPVSMLSTFPSLAPTNIRNKPFSASSNILR